VRVVSAVRVGQAVLVARVVSAALVDRVVRAALSEVNVEVPRSGRAAHLVT
jgi:hypothetical protein